MNKNNKKLLVLLLCSFLVACDKTDDSSLSQETSSTQETSSSVIESSSEQESSSVSESSSVKESSSVVESSSSISESTSSTSESSSVSESSSIEESSSISESSSESSTSSESSSESVSTDNNSAATPGEINLDNNSMVNASVNYGDYNFKLVNGEDLEKGYITLSKGGYVLNTTPFGDIDSFKVEYSVASPTGTQKQSDLGFGSLYYVTDTHTITSPRSYQKVEVTNNTLTTLEDNPNYIAFYTYNEIDIKSITINYNTTATYTETFSDFDMQLFATNDIHGQVNSDSSHAGLVNASGYIEEQIKNTKYNLMFDQGDIYQGSLACYLTGGHIMDDYLLMNGYESTINGNHEWDWKEQNIIEHREYCPEVKMLACNIRYKDGTTPSWVQNYLITERGGVKIGVIGACGDIADSISADMIENINFIVGDELSTMLAGYADELKEAGCDYIILQIHDGSGSTKSGSTYSGKKTETINVEYTSVDYSKLQNKVNLVLESHSHYSYFHTDKYGIPHIQCGGYLTGLGKITLHVTFNGSEPTVSFNNSDVILNNATYLKKYSSTFFKEVNDWYSANVYKEESETVVATVTTAKDKTAVENMQAAAYYDLKNVYPELASYDISVGGGYLTARSPSKLNFGNATKSDIANLFPFDNEMYLVKINGKDLKYSFLKDSYKLAGELNSDSRTDFNKDYYIICDSYNYFYMTKQQNNPIDLTIVVDLTAKYGIYPRDVLAMYLAKQYPITELVDVKVSPSTFDYTKESVDVAANDKVNITVNYSNVVDNAKYSNFKVNKTNGKVEITCGEGYYIGKVEVKQYGTYKNLKFYSDSSCANELAYSYTKDSDENYTFTIYDTTNTFVVSNTSNYDVQVFSITITLVENVD